MYCKKNVNFDEIHINPMNYTNFRLVFKKNIKILHLFLKNVYLSDNHQIKYKNLTYILNN
jgi:hypothetical protein